MSSEEYPLPKMGGGGVIRNGLHLSKKYIPSAKTLCTENLSSNITFNYLCENSPNSFSHFCNHKSFFSTQLISIIFAQTLYTFKKKIPIKVQIFRFFTAGVKIHQISHVIFQTKREFFKFQSLFSVMRDNSSALFKLKLYMLLTNVAH